MPNRLVLALVLASIAAPWANAQETPKDEGACFEMSSSLLRSAGTLSDDKNEKVQKLMKALENNCDAGKFAEAAEVAREVRALVGTN